MVSLKGKTIVITGASRGIGRSIALRVAAAGANLVISAKTVDDSDQKLKGTIGDVAEECIAAGGQAIAVKCDVRDGDQIQALMDAAVKKFGGIDALLNNAGAIKLEPVESVPLKRFDLLVQVNVRAAYGCCHAAIPYLKKSSNGHIINMSPPISLKTQWISGKTGYTITKYGMSLLTLGLADELRDYGIAVNSLWPRTAIATAAIDMLGGEDFMNGSRKPDIMADAAYELLTTPVKELTGQHLLDEPFLRERGYTDFDKYAYAPGHELLKDFYID